MCTKPRSGFVFMRCVLRFPLIKGTYKALAGLYQTSIGWICPRLRAQVLPLTAGLRGLTPSPPPPPPLLHQSFSLRQAATPLCTEKRLPRFCQNSLKKKAPNGPTQASGQWHFTRSASRVPAHRISSTRILFRMGEGLIHMVLG